VPGLDAAAEGAAGFGKQLWLLVANPIVAIIAGIVAALTIALQSVRKQLMRERISWNKSCPA
jgi:hypothetical protein